MSPESQILVFSAVAMAIAFAGAAVAVSIRKVTHFALCAMISVAAGALFGVTALHIIPESMELLTVLELAAGLASGYFLFYLVSRYVSHVCPACAATHMEERFMGLNVLMVVAISLHSTMDGIGIAVAQEEGASGFGAALLLAVAIHKLPEGLALASVARSAGYSRAKSFGIACGVETTTFIGAALSILFLQGAPPLWMGLIMAHIGGGFVFLTLHAMLGEMVKHERKSIVVYAFVGFMLILTASLGLLWLGA